MSFTSSRLYRNHCISERKFAVSVAFAYVLGLLFLTFLTAEAKNVSIEKNPTIAVLNFTAPVDEPELVEWGKRYGEFLTTELSKENWLNVVERIEIDKLLKEIELKLSGLSSVEQSVAIGKMLGAQFLVVGKLQSVEDRINIEADLVEVSTGNILARQKLKCVQDELSSQSSKLSSFILRELSNVIQVKKPDEKPKTIALLRFKNRSRFKRLNSLEETLPQMLMDDLKLIPGILVLERQHIEKILVEVQLTEFGLIEDATAQRALGADFVISGSFEEKIESGQPIEESDLEIVVGIRDVTGRAITKKVEVGGKSREFDSLERETAVKIVEALDIFPSIDESFAETERGRLLEAAIHYAKGLQILGIKDLEEGLGRLDWRQGFGKQCRAALNEFQKSIYLNPGVSDKVRFALAVTYKTLCEKKKTVDMFRQIVLDFPDSKWAGESLWELYWLCERPDKIGFLEQLVARYPEHARVCSAYRFMGESHKSKGNYLKAVESYSRYMETFPSKWERWHAVHVNKLIDFADCYLKLNKPQKAIKMLDETLEKHPHARWSDLLHMKLGDIYEYPCKDSEKAIAEYRAAINCFSGYRTFRKIAGAYLFLGRWKEAKEAYSQAIGYLSPEIWDQKKIIHSYLQKACACEHLDEWKEALECYKMIADKYDVTDKIKICYEKMGKTIPDSIDTQELKSLRYTMEGELTYKNITALAVDKEGLWVATNEYFTASVGRYLPRVIKKTAINYYNKKTKSWRTYGEKDDAFVDPITCIVIDKDAVWFGTVYGGVLRYDKAKDRWHNYTTKDGLFGDTVYTIDVDNESVWFGGESGDHGDSRGWICKMNKSDEKWYVYIPPIITGVSTGPYSTTCPGIVSLKSDGDYLWIGMASHKEIFRLHKPTGKWENLTSLAYRNWSGQFTGGDYSVRTIQADDDSIWLGTESRGLRRYDKFNNSWKSFYASYKASYWQPSHRTENVPANCRLPDNRIHSMAIDDNYVYIVAGNGLCAYSKKDNSWILIKAIPHDTRLHSSGYRTSSDAIMTVAIDEDSIWCGTRNNGLIRYLKPHALLTGDGAKDNK